MLSFLAQTAEVPWEVFGAGGATALVTGILVYVLKSTREQHKECNATIERVTGEFAKTADGFAKAVENSNMRFAESTQRILDEARKSHAEREALLIETLREFRGGPR